MATKLDEPNEHELDPSEPPRPEPPSVFELLAHRAQRSSDGALAAAVAVGLTGAFGTALLGARWAPVALGFVCAVAFGIWGIADRESAERAASLREHTRGALRVVKWTAVLIGTLAAAAILLSLLGRALGTWIS